MNAVVAFKESLNGNAGPDPHDVSVVVNVTLKRNRIMLICTFDLLRRDVTKIPHHEGWLHLLSALSILATLKICSDVPVVGELDGSYQSVNAGRYLDGAAVQANDAVRSVGDLPTRVAAGVSIDRHGLCP